MARFAPDFARLLEKHAVVIKGDRPWQKRLRLLQALWREEQGHPMGSYVPRGGPSRGTRVALGSRIAMPAAEDLLLNYPTEEAKRWVRAEFEANSGGNGDKLYGYPRLFEDLLSSQPLCFNLFAPLAEDLDLATSVLRSLWPDRVEYVEGIEFEWSPGRGDRRYLDNRSAFDVYIRHTAPGGSRGFIGVEVKYHEPLTGKPATMHGKPYREVALRSGAFVDPMADELGRLPIQQIWLDHLLALSMLDEGSHGDIGLFVFLYPSVNEACAAAIASYMSHLAEASTFEAITIEALVGALAAETSRGWVDDFRDRYLAYDKVDRALA